MSHGGPEHGGPMIDSEISGHLNGIFATLIYAGIDAVTSMFFPGTHGTAESNAGGGGHGGGH